MSAETFWSKLLNLESIALQVVEYITPSNDSSDYDTGVNRAFLATHIRLLNRESKRWAEKHIYSGIWLLYRKNTICVDDWVLENLLTVPMMPRLLSNPTFVKRLQNASELILDFGGQVYQVVPSGYNILYPQMSVERIQRRIYPVLLPLILFMTNVTNINIFTDIFARYPTLCDRVVGVAPERHVIEYNRSMNELYTTIIDRFSGLHTIQFHSHDYNCDTLDQIWFIPCAIRALATHGRQLRKLTFSTASTGPRCLIDNTEMDHVVETWTSMLNQRHLCFDNVLILHMNIGCLISPQHIARWFPQLRALTAHLPDYDENNIPHGNESSYYPEYCKNFTLSKWFRALTGELWKLELVSIYCHYEEGDEWIGSMVKKLAAELGRSRSVLKTLLLDLADQQGFTELGWTRHHGKGASCEDWYNRGQLESISTIQVLGQLFTELRTLKFSGWCTLGVTHMQRLQEFQGSDLIKYQNDFKKPFNPDSYLYDWKNYRSKPSPITIDNMVVHPNYGVDTTENWSLSSLGVDPELQPDESPLTVDHPSVSTVMTAFEIYKIYKMSDVIFTNMRAMKRCSHVTGAKLCSSLRRHANTSTC